MDGRWFDLHCNSPWAATTTFGKHLRRFLRFAAGASSFFRLSVVSFFATRWSCRTCEVLRTLQLFDFFPLLGFSFRPSVTAIFTASSSVSRSDHKPIEAHVLDLTLIASAAAAFIPVLATPDARSLLRLIYSLSLPKVFDYKPDQNSTRRE